jgi:hypothetical protein
VETAPFVLPENLPYMRWLNDGEIIGRVGRFTDSQIVRLGGSEVVRFTESLDFHEIDSEIVSLTDSLVPHEIDSEIVK